MGYLLFQKKSKTSMPLLTGLYRGLLGVLCCTVRVRPLEGSAVLHMDLGLLHSMGVTAYKTI